MTAVNLKSLIGKMNETTRRTLEAAAGLCLSRTHYNIEVEHWLMKLLEIGGTDIAAILSHFEVDTDRLNRDLTRVLDKLKTGNSRPPALAPSTCDVARDAWLHASVEFGDNRIRSGHILYAMLADDGLRLSAIDASPEFEKINRETLKREMNAITSDTVEQGEAVSATATSVGAPGAPRAKGPTSTPALDSYTIDLTARAKAGKIDPILGRDGEIRQIIDILTRRRQNNPILTGEAGVGKTAVAEGFALRVASGDVPPSMQNCSIRTLDLGLLQAGAGMKGEFENRLKQVMDEVKGSPTPIILFIDEAHTMVGAGGAAGQGDAANLLKPALARGDLRTIAATTWAEYKKYFEKDAALARRFQVVKVEEPSEHVCEQMMRGLVGTLEKHHSVRILNEGVVDAVKLSNRYISGRQLPDKAVSVLDTACARVNLSQTGVPPELEDARRNVDQLKISIEILQREEATGAAHGERIAEMREELGGAEASVATLEAQWEAEKGLVEQIQEIQAKLSGEAEIDTTATAAPSTDTAAAAATDAPPPAAEAAAQTPGDVAGEAAATEPPADPAAAVVTALADQEHAGDVARLRKLTAELEELQGEQPMIHYAVDSQAVGAVISSWTGIPVGRMVSNEIENVLNLKDRMAERVVGQDHALDAIAQSIRTSRAKLEDPNRPIGVFLMVGPSGVGKTETALTLAEQLYGGEQNMTVINMSEFKEEHKVSLLMGSPPGYVGYGEGGVLTNAVRRRPYSVVLLDEMEKAHPGVQDIFYQVFDKGQLRDGEGRDVDFKNTVVIMTSNAATDEIMKLCADPQTMPDAEGLQKALHPHLLDTFKPAFLGRVSVLPFFPLAPEVLRMIIKLKLGKVVRRVRTNYRATMEYAPEVVSSILSRCTEVASGARNVDNILNRTLLPELSAEFLSAMAAGKAIESVYLGLNDDGTFSYTIG